MAGAKASAFRLHQVDPGVESVGRSCGVGLCLVSKRAELSDGGAMDGLIAWEKHVQRVYRWSVCVRGSCESGLFLVFKRSSFVRRCEVRGVLQVLELLNTSVHQP